LACADDVKVVGESDETNNCRASAAAVTVALPDLVQQTVSNVGGPFRRGTAFTVSDSVFNDSRVGTPRATTTRYYLSADGVKSAGDILLIGARTVPILGAAAASSGSAAVTIPSTALPGTYVVLAGAVVDRERGPQLRARPRARGAARRAHRRAVAIHRDREFGGRAVQFGCGHPEPPHHTRTVDLASEPGGMAWSEGAPLTCGVFGQILGRIAQGFCH